MYWCCNILLALISYMFLLGQSEFHTMAAVECFPGYLGVLSEIPKLSLGVPEHREQILGTVALVYFLS